jgi:hypothetical protein
MKTLILTVKEATQAKIILRPGFAVVKIPGSLSYPDQIELRNKLLKIVDGNKDTNEFLKLYYKIGTPYLFLNRKISSSQKETFCVYKWEEL